MANPIPTFPMPDTRPGYAFQNPGDVGAIAGGLDQVLAALIQRRTQDQKQQQIGIDQQQVDQQGVRLRQAAEQAQAEQAAQLAQLLGHQQVGAALGAMTRPDIPLTGIDPQGALMPVGTIAPATLGQATQMVNPENVAEVLKQGGPIQKERDAKAATAKAEADRKRAQEAFLRGLPPDLRQVGQLAVMGKESGISPDVTALLTKQITGAVKPETIQMIVSKHPDWAGLPPEKLVELFVDEEKNKSQARYRPPPSDGAKKLLQAPPAIKSAYNDNIQTVGAIDRLIRMFGYDPEDDSKDALKSGGLNSAQADSVQGRRAAIGSKNVRGIMPRIQAAKGNTIATDVIDAMQKIRFAPLRKASGANMTKIEREEAGFLPAPKEMVALSTNISRLRQMRAFALEQNQLMEGSYSPDNYAPLQTKPTIPMDPTTRRSTMRGLTGTYKP